MSVVFTIGGTEFPVPLISFADAKRHSLVGPPELLDQIERVCTMLAALLHTEENPMSAATLMEKASLGEALELPKCWAELMQRSGVPLPAPVAPPPPLPEMPSLSVAVPEQTAGLGPNFPDAAPLAGLS